MSGYLQAYGSFLDRVLPVNYHDCYQFYRHDRALRSDFQVACFEEGWIVPEWPREVGGRELDPIDGLSIRLAGAERRVPRYMNIQGVGVVAPSLRAFGTAQQQRELLVPTLRGDLWWALGMSEPDAGSDLASLRTTATNIDGGFVVRGQKVWTTQADESRWCTLYVRTDSTAPAHGGISCLVVDLSSPGVHVRPIATASPAIDQFCEVFFDDVHVPGDALLGPLHGGWGVAMSSLAYERDMIWVNTWLETRRALDPVLTAADLSEDALSELGASLRDAEALRLMGLRSAVARARGQEADTFSMLKLLGSQSVQAAASLALEVTGTASLEREEILDDFMESLCASIYGGTSEIQRNVIAERILGLPKG